MRIGFFVNDVATEQPEYTTNRLALAAINRGHEAWEIGAKDLSYDSDEKIKAFAYHAPKSSYKSPEAYCADLQSRNARKEEITVDDLDVLMLRSDPSQETGNRFWAQSAGIDFGRIAMRHGVIVVNDPNGLAKAMNKMYFQLFPEEVRPRTLISQDKQKILDFAKEQDSKIVLKPLQGSGGKDVFIVNKDQYRNLGQIIDTICKKGYVIAQEYLPAAQDGDTRLFVMNGRPLKYKGKYAAFRRIRSGDDFRSNIHAGGSKAQANITDVELKLADIVSPKLVQDGMFMVGLDIVGDKLMEINVFSPGGLGSARIFEKVNFSNAVIDSFEHKVNCMSYYKRNFDNVEMSTL